MKVFTPKKAKLVANWYFNRHKNIEEKNFAKVHAAAVVEIAILLAKKSKLDVSSIEMAAWLHDIGSTVERDDHAKFSLDLLEQEGFGVSELIKDCILNHGTNGKPKSEEAKILQMADKLSILSIPVLKLIFKQQSITLYDIEFVNKMTTGAVAYLKELSIKGI